MALAPANLLAELRTVELVKGALDEVNREHHGVFCLSRLISEPKSSNLPTTGPDPTWEPSSTASFEFPRTKTHIPPGTNYLNGAIATHLPTFTLKAPQTFDLILLDPPWPNASARRARKTTRSRSYTTATSLPELRALLLDQVTPVVADRLAPDGLLGIWVTNKPALLGLLTAHGGRTG